MAPKLNPKVLLIDLDDTLLGVKNLPVSFAFVRESVKEFSDYGGVLATLKILYRMNSALQEEDLKTNQKTNQKTNLQRVIESLAKDLKIASQEADQIYRKSLGSLFAKLEKHFYKKSAALEFLKWAKPKYPLILATNPVWPQDIVEMRMKWGGLDPSWFQSITHSDCMHSIKPSIDYYREVVSLTGVSATDCFMIGNDFDKDLSATEIGISVFIVAKNTKFAKIRRPKGHASAWKGSFADARRLIE